MRLPHRPQTRLPNRTKPLLLGSLLLGLAWYAAGAAADALPDPLRLEQALTFAEAHPRVQLGDAPAPFPRRQPLYLGCHALAHSGGRGRDDARDVAWSALLPPVAAQRLEIMQRFYDVLLADLSYSRDNEAMAVAYIQFDRAMARAELGQFSPLRVAQLEAAYQLIRRQRAASEVAQRVTRSLLAQALGTPGELPRELVTPPLLQPDDAVEVAEPDAVVTRALADNRRIVALLDGAGPPRRALIEMEVRQLALELVVRLQLLAVVAEQTRAESNWRDLKLDESRTLYELEAQADLGFSMSQQTKARRDEEAVALCRSLTRAELDALQGRPVRARPGALADEADPANGKAITNEDTADDSR